MSNNPINMTAVELQQLDREELQRLARQVTPAQRQEILRRDGYPRCPLRGHEAKNPYGVSALYRTAHIFSGCTSTTLFTGRMGGYRAGEFAHRMWEMPSTDPRRGHSSQPG